MVFCELHNGVACFSLSTVTLKLFGSRGNPERCWIAVMAAALRNSEIASAKARAAESLKESLKESLESLKELHNSLDAHGGCFAEVKAAESLNTVPGVAESEGVRATSPEESAPSIENGSRCYFDCGESEGRGNGGQVVGAEKVGVRGREEGITTEGKKLKVYR